MSLSGNTPVTFTRDEARRIREMMGTRHEPVLCPRCGVKLVLVGPIAGDGSMGPMFEVTCRPCHRSAIVTETPGTRGSADQA